MGWEKVACWSPNAVISLKRIKIEEKLLWMAYWKSSTLFRFFGSLPYFYFRFPLYGHRDGRFCLIFAHIAHQSVLDDTNGLSSSKPCAYCWMVRSCTSLGNLCDSTAFLLFFPLYWFSGAFGCCGNKLIYLVLILYKILSKFGICFCDFSTAFG